jgi:hypothetical protein
MLKGDRAKTTHPQTPSAVHESEQLSPAEATELGPFSKEHGSGRTDTSLAYAPRVGRDAGWPKKGTDVERQRRTSNIILDSESSRDANPQRS